LEVNFVFFKQKTAYEIRLSLVSSEMCIRDRFLEFPDRMMIGTDTFTPERWPFVPEHARWSREWIADLPDDVAEKIAWRNAEALLQSGRGWK